MYNEPTKQDKKAFPEFPKKTLFFKLKYKKINKDKKIIRKTIDINFVNIINEIIQKIIVEAYKPFVPSIKFEAL